MKIRSASLNDIAQISELEEAIEKENAASSKTIFSRLKMFPEGFLVAKEKNRVVGYLESCLWDKNNFETFNEIKDFPKNHNQNSKTLYIIFLAVAEDQRRKEVGSELVKTIIGSAKNYKLEKVQLVAGEGFLVDFYRGLGFQAIRSLPNFLPYSSGTLMENYLK